MFRFARFAIACRAEGTREASAPLTHQATAATAIAATTVTILPYCPVAATLAHILASETSDLIRFGVVAGGDQHRCRSVVYEGPLVLRPEWWIGAQRG